MIRLLHGDCRDVLATMEPGSLDACVCDPPYELGFMGKGWDATGIANDPLMWAAVFRVLKPGAHLLAFSGTRTYHRMVCAIEDAGFEIRDQIGWLYGSGFPKSLDVSKAIDKAAGATREFTPRGNAVRRMIPGADQDATGSWIKDNGREYQPGESEPATDAARQWQGWGTALKPAWEPIVVARKPLIGTVAANVLAHGTGALNIDASRIEVTDESYARNASGDRGHDENRKREMEFGMTAGKAHDLGRWPANIIHDGSEEVLAAFPQAPGAFAPITGAEPSSKTHEVYGAFRGRQAMDRRDGGGSAARFFYTAKASRHDRNDGTYDLPQVEKAATWGDLGAVEGNARKPKTAHVQRQGNVHPTVKPTDLMRYLCRLVTPPGGTVLDPFAGSGSTLKAAELEGLSAIGIELDPAYIEIARRRIASDAPLFAEVT